MSDEHSAPTAPARTPGEPPRPAAARQARAALLSGLPLDALPGPARRHAEHLTAALRAVTVPRPGDTDSAEPPEPLLAAFRAAHPRRTADAAAAGTDAVGVDAPGTTPVGTDAPGTAPVGADAVGAPARRTGPRGCARGLGPGSWARSTRLAAAGVLSIGMIGGVAVAAGAGALTSPFPSPVDQRAPLPHGTTAPAPTGSADERSGQAPQTLSSGEPTASPSRQSPSTPPSPSPLPRSPSTSPPPPPDSPAGSSPAGSGGTGSGTGPHTSDVLRPCQDQRRGRPLDVLALRRLARAAHGAAAVPEFCRQLLGLPPGPWRNVLLPPGSPIPLTPGDGAPAPEPPATSPAAAETAPGSPPTYGYGGAASRTPRATGTPRATDAETTPAAPTGPAGPGGEPGPEVTPSAAPGAEAHSSPAGDPAS
ncbi:hypothetical protein [Streptomyces sp. NPDC007088]|uniref:hypothetical protein n=1 Tax=Streptomyces sp. NPDC007088 TaxID=3364773 RepID=UPI0036CC478D